MIVERRYVAADGRRVHYRRSGVGPPLVMLHGSPGNSEMLLAEMAVAAEHFTCFALDTPGFGESEALPGDELTVLDLARATVQAMDALGLPQCPVYGTHTGAAIGIEIGVGWPGRVTGLVLEGLPMFTADEIGAVFEGYFNPIVTDPLGGHLTSTWMRFRDQFTWFPWTSRDVTYLNPVDRPSAEDIQQWVMMFNRSRDTYEPAYRAACFYGDGARRAAEALTVPAIFFASAEDMLFAHLDRLPPPKSNQRIERLPYDSAAKQATIAAMARSLPQGTADAPSPSASFVGHSPAVQFTGPPSEQIFVRAYGDPALPPVLLLHDAPGSGWAMEPLALRLAHTAYVVVPDLPGNGESLPPVGGSATLDATAVAVVALLSELDLARVTVVGIGCGASVASVVAARRDPRGQATLLEGVPLTDLAIADGLAPPIDVSCDGSHWLRVWLMIRDAEIWWPWFDGRAGCQRRVKGNFDADWLHRQTFEVMKARTSYHRLPQLAFGHDPIPALALGGDVRLALRGDHPLHCNDRALIAACQNLTAVDMPLARLILATIAGDFA